MLHGPCYSGFRDADAAEIARIGMASLRASGAVFYWVEGPVGMADVELEGLRPGFFAHYASEMIRFDPLHVHRMEAKQQRVAQLAPAIRQPTAENEAYGRFLAEYGISDVVDLLFWSEGVAVAGLGLLKRRSDPPFCKHSLETAFALQRFVEHTLHRHHRIARQRLRQNLIGAYQLTGREIRVAELAAEGLTNAEIAGRLHVALATVKTHLLRILAKTGCGNRTHLAAMLAQAAAPAGLYDGPTRFQNSTASCSLPSPFRA